MHVPARGPARGRWRSCPLPGAGEGTAGLHWWSPAPAHLPILPGPEPPVAEPAAGGESRKQGGGQGSLLVRAAAAQTQDRRLCALAIGPLLGFSERLLYQEAAPGGAHAKRAEQGAKVCLRCAWRRPPALAVLVEAHRPVLVETPLISDDKGVGGQQEPAQPALALVRRVEAPL